MSEEEIIEQVKWFLKFREKESELEMYSLKDTFTALEEFLNKYNNLKAIEQEHQKINGELREELDIQIEHNKEIDNMNKILANTIRGDSIIINDSISKDKIREKIEELKSSREFYQNFPDDYMAEILINVLKELLEE